MGRIGALVAALLLIPASEVRAEVDLVGTWHVLVHYTDDNAAHPEASRWVDFVWQFEPSGSRFRWSEWPIVVFDDDTGRFQRSSSGYSRVVHAWQPNDRQLSNIHAGLAVNDRGSKSKTLRRSDTGWRSSNRASAASVAVITYQETWSVEDPSGLPVFIREDVLASGTTENMEGRTEYRTREVREGGAVLVGDYQRDGTRRGTFRMMRAGAKQALAERSQREMRERLQPDALQGLLEEDPVRGAVEHRLAEKSLVLDPDQVDALVDEARELIANGASENDAARRVVDAARKKPSP